MEIPRRHLRPHLRLALLALVLAAAAQILGLVDPIIFGTIIDKYAIHRAGGSEDQGQQGELAVGA